MTMANRDYYGNNVPLDLVGEQESRQFLHTQTRIQSPDAQSNLSPSSNQDTHNPSPAPSTTQHTTYEQDQTQWRDPASPEYGSHSAEGEKGLGSTIVGGAGGAFVGHEVGKKSEHGILGTMGGAIAGAIAANIASHAVKDHGQDHGQNQGYGQGYDHGYDHGCGHRLRAKHGCGLGGRLRERRIERLERRLDRLQ